LLGGAGGAGGAAGADAAGPPSKVVRSNRSTPKQQQQPLTGRW